MSMDGDSLERQKYHDWLEKFKAYLAAGNFVYDVGKSAKYDYAQTFRGYKYITIDINSDKKPDLMLNMEDEKSLAFLTKADAIICNGVVEQCENPYQLFKVLFEILKPGGYALIGTVLTGFPVYDNDRVRFTAMGIRNVLKEHQLIDSEVIYRAGVVDPTYMYLIVRKNETLS